MTRFLPRRTLIAMAVGAAAALLVACAQMGAAKEQAPVTLAPNVDLPRFMGAWYVIANIPTFPEKGAYNAVERYTLESDGSIGIDFSFRADSFEGAPRRYTSRGFVQPAGNAVWGIQFVWPFKADYRISYVASDYSATIITRQKRDYVWIMARTPTISEADYALLLAKVAAEGYDPAKVQKVPQQAVGRS